MEGIGKSMINLLCTALATTDSISELRIDSEIDITSVLRGTAEQNGKGVDIS